MLRFMGKLPQSCYVACSGGSDSMAVVDFFLNGRKQVELLHFNHRTSFGEEAANFVYSYAEEKDLQLHTGMLSGVFKIGKSQEEFWRDERYKFLNKFTDKPIVVCHNLDDVMETYLFSALHGTPKLIPYKRDPNIIRPFLLTRKKDFKKWCDDKDVLYKEDPANRDYSYMRSLIRHKMLPVVEEVNEGFDTVIRKKVQKDFDNR